MTRVKKTRSLKRIHSTKTGSKSQIRKELASRAANPQGAKRVKGRRVLSAYEKFLLENPQAQQDHTAEQMSKQKIAEAAKLQTTQEESAGKKAALAKEETKKEYKKSLLEQLEEKNINDLY